LAAITRILGKSLHYICMTSSMRRSRCGSVRPNRFNSSFRASSGLDTSNRIQGPTSMILPRKFLKLSSNSVTWVRPGRDEPRAVRQSASAPFSPPTVQLESVNSQKLFHAASDVGVLSNICQPLLHRFADVLAEVSHMETESISKLPVIDSHSG